VPIHMHIDLELLDSVHLICAMLLEVPTMTTKCKVISRTFRRLLDNFDHKLLSGTLENSRDYVAAAAKALAVGTSLPLLIPFYSPF
jgi:translation initiation factor 3 subunit C